MNLPIFRYAQEADFGTLIRIWRLSFGDSREAVADFLRRFFDTDSCLVAECGGAVVSAMYALHGAELGSGNISYLYALGTLPEYRSQGLGAEVARELSRRKYAEGYDFVCTMPATDSLYGWYEKVLGAHCAFTVRERRFRLCEPSENIVIKRLSALDYLQEREKKLAEIAHVSFSEKLLEYQNYICEASGGGLFSLCGGCAAVEKRGKTLYIKELLAPTRAVNALMRELGTTQAIARTPSSFPAAKAWRLRKTAAVLPNAGREIVDAYWGFVFD